MKKSWINGKTVLITGASGGLGFNVAKILIENYDAKIIGIARNQEKMEKSLSLITKNRENFSYYLFDVSKKENWQNLKCELDKNGIKIDVLFNNAGFMLDFNKFESFSLEQIDKIVETNYLAYLYSISTFIEDIKKSSAPSIINLVSSAGLCPVVGQSLYSSTKYALRGFTETLIQEYKKTIYVAGIYPGFINTNIVDNMKLTEDNKNLIQNFMMDVKKAAKKIVKSILKKKKKIVIGLDGKFISFMYKIFPNFTPSFIKFVLKTSKLKMFENLFLKEKSL